MFNDWKIEYGSHVRGGAAAMNAGQTYANSNHPELSGAAGTNSRAIFYGELSYIDSGYAYWASSITSSYQSGAFVDVPNSKAIRVQAALSMYGNASGSKSGVFLKAKSLNNKEVTGYEFGIKCTSVGAGSNWVEKKRYSLVFQGPNSYTSEMFLSGGISTSKFYNLRMEVYPNTNFDTVKCYVEQPILSNNWVQLGSNIIISSSSPDYVAWGGSSGRSQGIRAYSNAQNIPEVGETIATLYVSHDMFTGSIANAP